MKKPSQISYKQPRVVYVILSIVLLVIIGVSCTKQLLQPKNNIVFNRLLSYYNVFKGDPKDLVPSDEFHNYYIVNALFTNYAEKQRLMKLPAGTQLKYASDGLPAFPDGTMLVKTFYYYHNKTNPALGKQIIETRLMILEAGQWNVATYIWNELQNDAIYEESGATRPVEWINEGGQRKSINYHIPNLNECATCHNANNEVVPIGFKMRNLNTTITENGTEINQLQSWMQSGWLGSFDSQKLTKVAGWNDASQPLEQRVRSYLDINCAHCHNPSGFASFVSMNFGYTVPFEQTHIKEKRKGIVKRMESGAMPKLGTTVVDEKALSLIKAYLNSL